MQRNKLQRGLRQISRMEHIILLAFHSEAESIIK